jgi:hypothetical protein
MDENIKKIIKSSCVEPLTIIQKIINSKDTNVNKLVAIQLYCKKILEIINETIDANL